MSTCFLDGMEESRQESKNPGLLKADLRRQALTRRRGLSSAYRTQADRAILEKVLALEAYRKAETVFIYVSREDEVDTRELIAGSLAAGKRVAVPRCAGKGRMKAYQIKSMEELEEGTYGILEPKESCPEMEPGKIDLAVVPCVACSREGIRLGYGGGYYDRYLPMCPALRVLLCYEKLIFPFIPPQSHDCRMDMVVTENIS